MKTSTVTSAGGVLYDDKGRIALTGRRSFKGELHWGLPKGMVEPGETTAEAAQREATEETGFEVEVLDELRTIEYWYAEPARANGEPTRIHKFVHYFLMKIIGGDPSRHDFETEEVALLEAEEAIQRASFGNEKEVIAGALALISR